MQVKGKSKCFLVRFQGLEKERRKKMAYSRYDTERAIGNRIQNVLYEGAIYMDMFTYEWKMEYDGWEYYEELDYPILISSPGVPLEQIKNRIGIEDKDVVALNEEKDLYLCAKLQNGQITRRTKWFVTTKTEESYVTEDFMPALNKYLEENKLEVSDEEGIAEAMEEERVRANKKEKESAERRIREADREITKYERYIEDYKKELEKCERTLEALKKETNIKDKIEEEIKCIKEHELVKDVFYKPIKEELIIYTKELYMQHPKDKNDRRFLGEMKIELNVNNYSVRLFNETECRKGYWGDDCNHPHVSDEGEPCLGNSSEMLAECKITNDLYIAFLTILGFLQTFDVEDIAGEYYVCWDKVDKNGNVIEKGQEDKYVAQCAICGEGLYEDDDIYCCAECGATVCADHFYLLDDEDMCENCYVKYARECYNCGEEHNKEKMYVVDEHLLCEDCFQEEVRICTECGDEHLAENMVEDVDTGDWYCKECWNKHQKGENEDV